MREAERRYRRVRSVDEAIKCGAICLTSTSGRSSSVATLQSHHRGLFLLPGFLSKGEQEQYITVALTSWNEPPHRRNFEADGRARDTAPSLLFNTYVSGEQKRDDGVLSLNDLTWSTLGRHYDWTNRSYPPPSSTLWHSPLPKDIDKLVTKIVDTVRLESTSSRIIDSTGQVTEGLVTNTEGVNKIRSTDEIDDLPFSPQTVIVNYYSATSATGSKFPMGAHRDDLESAIKSPVVSVSLGCACVFLLEKESDPTSEPTALVLSSGDALLLSGKSRLSLHGVSVVFKKCELGECTLKESEDEGYCTRCGSLGLFEGRSSDVNIDALKRYIKSHRINVNARQVD